jgi:hypothetical protein
MDDLEARLRAVPPPRPRPGLRDEVLGSVHRELHPAGWGKLALAASVLLAALLLGALQEAGHQRRKAALVADSVHPRVELAVRRISPWLESDSLTARLRLRVRRPSDLRWTNYLTARRERHG